ncbi:uncharacterized protein [Tiliqua scincoides]|uniref:uncharacterized protein n=1 Tax=Tiliqua scincoides TaxID=71010 RepID=UPI003461830E
MWGGGRRLLPGRLLLLLLLLVGELAFCSAEVCKPYKGIEGEDITLSAEFKGKLTDITWKKEMGTTFNKVAQWDGELHLYSHLVKRAGIDQDSGNLTIRDISQKIDGGRYMGEPLVNGSYLPTYVCLEILEPPSAPNLACTIDDDGIHVNCTSVTRYELPVSYHWNYTNMNDISNEGSSEEHSSIKLPKNTDQSEYITCIIVASRSTVNNSISLKTCESRGKKKRVKDGGRENETKESEGASLEERGRIIILLSVAVLVGLVCCIVFLWEKKVGHCLRKKKTGIPEGHTDEEIPFHEEGPENVIVQTSSRENPPNDESASNHGPTSEPENKKTFSSEENPENHIDESKPSHGLVRLENPENHIDESKPSHGLKSERENKKTSSSEDMTTPES